MSTPSHRKFEHKMIQSPGPRLLHGCKLESVRKRAEGGGHRSVSASLNLTSFIDFLIVVVVFLLMSFSASGEVPLDPNTQLPAAENTVDMTAAPLVSVTGTQIMVDGVAAGTTRSIEEAGRMMRVDELAQVLRTKREFWLKLNPGQDFHGIVVLQIDRRVPALVVKSVFRTAAEAGYPHVSFMVGQIARPAAH